MVFVWIDTFNSYIMEHTLDTKSSTIKYNNPAKKILTPLGYNVQFCENCYSQVFPAAPWGQKQLLHV